MKPPPGGDASRRGSPRGAALLAALLAVPLVTCDAHRPVVLGVSTSPSYVDAARLAVEDELAAGALPGFDTVFIPQGQNLASPAIEAAMRMVEVEGLVAVIGHSNSAASLATAPIYNEHRVVQIAPTASAVVYSDAGPYSFRLVPPDDRQGGFLADRLQDILPRGGRVAVVYVQDDYGRGLRTAFVERLDTLRFRIIAELPHVEADLLGAEVAYTADALGAASPDVIVWLARGQTLARTLSAIRRLLPRAPILGSDGLAGGGLAATPSALMGDVRYVAYLDLESTEALRTFARRYRERYGREATGSEALTYDAVRLAMSGIRAGARAGEELRAFLQSIGQSTPLYQGITGSVSFDADGDVDRPYVLVVPHAPAGQ